MEREKRMQKAVLSIKKKYGKNAILKQEAGNRGTIYVNGNFNEGFSAYFRAE